MKQIRVASEANAQPDSLGAFGGIVVELTHLFPMHATLLYPQKILENLKVSDVFMGQRKGTNRLSFVKMEYDRNGGAKMILCLPSRHLLAQS